MSDKKRLIVGIELGTPGERSAIAVVERVKQYGQPDEYHVRELKRLGPRITYSEIRQEVIAILGCKSMTGNDLEVRAIIDQTAVGAAIANHVIHGTQPSAAQVKISGDHPGRRE